MDKQEFVLAVIDRVNEKRKEISILTSRIFELEKDLNPKNILEIKQNVGKVVHAIGSFSYPLDVHGYEVRANLILDQIERYLKDSTVIPPTFWKNHITFNLQRFCIRANAWKPINFDLGDNLKIEFKNVNFSFFNVNK